MKNKSKNTNKRRAALLLGLPLAAAVLALGLFAVPHWAAGLTRPHAACAEDCLCTAPCGASCRCGAYAGETDGEKSAATEESTVLSVPAADAPDAVPALPGGQASQSKPAPTAPQAAEEAIPTPQEQAAAAEEGALLACNFYDERQFQVHLAGSEAAAEELGLETVQELRGVILPHHLTAGAYIAAVFAAAAEEQYDTVFFLAPNHTGEGGNIVYSLRDWDTPFGTLACDRELSEELMLDAQINGNSNDARMQADHSISGLIPYLAYYMPEAETVSVLLSGSVDLTKVRYLADRLAQSEKKILLICSVDFSHYLQSNEAAQKDAETVAAISAANFPVIADYGNDHFDSAPCVTAFLRYAQSGGLEHELHWQGNSAALCGYGSEKYIEGGITTYQIWMLNGE